MRWKTSKLRWKVRTFLLILPLASFLGACSKDVPSAQNTIDARLLDPGEPPRMRTATVGELSQTLGEYVVSWNEVACKLTAVREILTTEPQPTTCEVEVLE
jgi:hypothetical protein